MCLLVIAWRVHPGYRLIVAANRDEFHERPATPLAPWTDSPDIVGGRDVQAGGTWFAIDTRERCGIVTNFREFGRRRRNAPSRGGLIPAYLKGTRPPGEYLRVLETDAPGYAGFNLLLADHESLWYASNRADTFARALSPGVYALSNEFLDTPWPKVVRVRERFAKLLERTDIGAADLAAGLFTMLADRETAPAASLPAGDLSLEWARKLSAPFVVDPGYGTRCSTVLTISPSGSLRIAERRFTANGAAAGETEHLLNAASTC